MNRSSHPRFLFLSQYYIRLFLPAQLFFVNFHKFFLTSELFFYFFDKI